MTNEHDMEQRNVICYPIDQHQQDARFKLLDERDPVPTLSAKMGDGGNNTPMVLEVLNDG